MSIGTRIRKAREEKGLSAATLAHKVGVTEKTLLRYERDETAISVLTLLRVAQELDEPIQAFTRDGAE